MPLDIAQIKNIIFDLGGVILNLDPDAQIKAFEALGVPDFNRLYSKGSQSALFVDLETGMISPEIFRKRLREQLSIELPDELIDKAWNAILKDFPAEHIRLLVQLKTRFRLFLLSNTNAIHYEVFSQTLRAGFGYNDLRELMEKVYYSHQVGLHKPDPRIFEFVLEDAALSPEETLFIDDSEQHVNSARQAGLKAYHLKEEEGILELFSDFI